MGSILTLATEEAFVISSGVPFDSIAPCVIPVKEGMGGSAALHKAKFLGASYVCHELEVHTSPFCRARVNRVLLSISIPFGEVSLRSIAVEAVL